MTVEEKRAMKAACVQAAATLVAAWDSRKDQIDVEKSITLAALLYVRGVKADWGAYVTGNPGRSRRRLHLPVSEG